jgi:hypothetical protein
MESKNCPFDCHEMYTNYTGECHIILEVVSDITCGFGMLPLALAVYLCHQRVAALSGIFQAF